MNDNKSFRKWFRELTVDEQFSVLDYCIRLFSKNYKNYKKDKKFSLKGEVKK